MSTEMSQIMTGSQRSDIYREPWIWGSVLASVPEAYREELQQWTLTVSCACKTGGQMDWHPPPKQAAAAEEDAECLSQGGCSSNVEKRLSA